MKFKVLLVFVSLIIIGVVGYVWHQAKVYPSTDNAYIQAEVLSVSPMVTGQVTQITVQDFQHVQKGDLLIQLQRNKMK